MKKGKDTWTAHLPPFANWAAGALRHNEIFVLAVLDTDKQRTIRLEIPVDRVADLANQLLEAAEKAQQIPAYVPPTQRQNLEQLGLPL